MCSQTQACVSLSLGIFPVLRVTALEGLLCLLLAACGTGAGKAVNIPLSISPFEGYVCLRAVKLRLLCKLGAPFAACTGADGVGLTVLNGGALVMRARRGKYGLVLSVREFLRTSKLSCSVCALVSPLTSDDWALTASTNNELNE